MQTATDGSVRLEPGPRLRHRPGPDGRVPGSPTAPPQPAGSGRLADGRGFTAAGAVLLALALGLAGTGLDIATGTGLRTAFAVLFVLGCVAAAAVVHHEDLMAAVVMPPLLFVGLAAAASMLEGGGLGGSWLTRRTLDVVTAMVTQAPVLFIAMGAVLVVIALRLIRYRVSVRRRRAAARSRTGPSPASA